MKLTFVVHITEPPEGRDMPELQEIVNDLTSQLDSGDPAGGVPKSILINRVECTSISSDEDNT